MNTPTIELMEIVDPEAVAMIQAFYSRSPMPIRDRLRELECEFLLDPPSRNDRLAPLKKKLGQYYVGYGHESIGELGEVVIFIENVSLIAAKAVQHSPLYQGQEVSTRYVDFSTQPCLPQYTEKVDKWRDLYVRALPEIKAMVAEKHADVRDEKLFEKTVAARAFDIARGLLPAAFLTSLAWKTSLSHARKHLRRMYHSEIQEVKQLASAIRQKLNERYPNAIPLEDEASVEEQLWWGPSFYARQAMDPANNELMVTTMSARNETYYRPYGGIYFNVTGNLDFGSWRDLARHRNGFMAWTVPNIDSVQAGNWYLKNMPSWVQDEVSQLCIYHNLMLPEDHMYLAPLMTPALTNFTWHTGQMNYVLKLRTGKTVHDTLRHFMQQVFLKAQKLQANKLVTNVNMEEEGWTLKRGAQDIVKKDS